MENLVLKFLEQFELWLNTLTPRVKDLKQNPLYSSPSYSWVRSAFHITLVNRSRTTLFVLFNSIVQNKISFSKVGLKKAFKCKKNYGFSEKFVPINGLFSKNTIFFFKIIFKIH